jgi:hypothetical protein
MVSVSLHLDDCGMDNGPLKVRPGTHGFARLTRERMDELASEVPEEICCLRQGRALHAAPAAACVITRAQGASSQVHSSEIRAGGSAAARHEMGVRMESPTLTN